MTEKDFRGEDVILSLQRQLRGEEKSGLWCEVRLSVGKPKPAILTTGLSIPSCSGGPGLGAGWEDIKLYRKSIVL